MEYLYAFLALLGVIFLTNILSGIFGVLIPLGSFILGLYLGSTSLIVTIGAAIGAAINISTVNRYLATAGAMSSAPRISKTSSYALIIGGAAGYLIENNGSLSFSFTDHWFYILGAVVSIIGVLIYRARSGKKSVDRFLESVTEYEIIAKYEDDPKWATYLRFANGNEMWNETIPGSFRAKDPKHDLTFVHESKEAAERYAEHVFVNATYIKSSEG